MKSRFIFEKSEDIENLVNNTSQMSIFKDIEMPLVYVLAEMEKNGFKFENTALKEMKEELVLRLETITNEIYEMSGEVFNIQSPIQLGEVLFEKMGIGKGQKNHRGYKTDIKTLKNF